MENTENNISGVYALHHNTTFEINGNKWEIQTKYNTDNTLVLINKTTGKYISALFKVKKYPDMLNFDFEDNMYFMSIDGDAVYIEYLNKKVRRK